MPFHPLLLYINYYSPSTTTRHSKTLFIYWRDSDDKHEPPDFYVYSTLTNEAIIPKHQYIHTYIYMLRIYNTIIFYTTILFHRTVCTHISSLPLACFSFPHSQQHAMPTRIGRSTCPRLTYGRAWNTTPAGNLPCWKLVQDLKEEEDQTEESKRLFIHSSNGR